MNLKQEAGFSAVELLITLFVLAAFLVAGVQLYNVVINDGAASRAEARASNIAYGYLRQYSTTAKNPCAPSTILNGESVEVQGLVNVSVTVSVTCPYGTSSDISKVEAKVTYNNPSETVVQATFVNKGSGASESSVTNGLVAWWKFNGSAKDSIGTADGSVSGATLTTGQDGRANSAYSFNGSNSYVDAQVTTGGGDYKHSISLWLYPTTLSGSRVDPFTMGNPTNSQYSSIDLYSTSTSWYFYFNDTNSPTVLPLNQWSLLTLTYAGGGGTTTNKKMYINGVNQSLTSSGGEYGFALNLPSAAQVGIGRDRGRNTAYYGGRIDDVRLYSRALSATEVQTLFTEGAF